MPSLSVPIEAELHNEFILRNRSAADVSHAINNVIADYLDRTAGDALIWHEDYVNEFEKQQNKYAYESEF